VDRSDDWELLAPEVAHLKAPGLSDDPEIQRAVEEEDRDLGTYYADLRAAVDAGHTPRDGAREAVQGSDRPPSADSSTDEEAECGSERIHEIEATVLSPQMRQIEADDQMRDLAGFEYRLKGAERLKEKVARDMLDKGFTAQEALAGIPDAVRYTFRYGEQHYAAGVHADIGRLRGCGFDLVKMRNSWHSDQYRGINSQWREPNTGQRFEVQFHTSASYDTK
jgi:hypothetical protein